jgi:5-oxoprolinase (ATP-hydrolysing) subunit A
VAASAVDFNLDLGEASGPAAAESERQLMGLVTSANVACGFHAGDPSAMAASVALAKELGVAVGAHPGLPDRLGFGRRAMAVSPAEVRDYVAYQVGALGGFLRRAGLPLHHVKAHGALYMQAAQDATLARALVESAARLGPGIPIYTQEGTEVWHAAERAGVWAVAEYNADRPLRRDGSIVLPAFAESFDQSPSEGFEHTPEFVAAQVETFLSRGAVPAFDGGEVSVRAQTISVHSDGPGAVALARAVRQGAQRAGVRLTSELPQPAWTVSR